MADLLLITPPVTLRERYGKLAGAANTLPSLGILYLAAVLRQKGYSISVIESSSLGLTMEQAIEKISTIKPRYIGLTATTLTIMNARALASEIKKIDDRIQVIVGGPHITAIPEETMNLSPAFDIGVIGEGEETIKDLLEALESRGNLSTVQGIIFRHGDRVIKTSPRDFIKDLDSLPFPAWDLLEAFPGRYSPPPFRFKKLPAAYIVTTRGCPHQCIFCDRSVFGNKCRGHSAEYIMAMIEYLRIRFGVREILFEDDTFVTFKERLLGVCEGMLSQPIKTSWSCLGRADAVTPDLLRLMKRAGCWSISYGIETGDEGVMKFIGKKTTLDKIEQAVRWTKEAGLLSKGFFIIGHPVDTHETIRKTMEYALSLPLDDISISMMTPFPGSRIYDLASQYGEFTDDWTRMNELEAVFIPKGMTKPDLENYSRELYRKFYLRPSKIINYLGRVINAPRSLPLYLKGLSAFLRGTARRPNFSDHHTPLG